jgi:uncharacterized protein (TIGR00369 family)
VYDFLFNPHGSLHGGVIATVLDISMGHLLQQQYGRAGSTLQLNIQYVRALRSGRAECEAEVIHRGRRIAFQQTRRFEEAPQLAASATSTWKIPASEGERD